MGLNLKEIATVRKIDMANLIARDTKEKVDKKRFGFITIAFNTVRGE